MEDTIINLVGCSATDAEVDKLNEMLDVIFEKEQIHVTTSKSFNGIADVIIILSIGGGVAIKQLANIVIQWLKSNQGKKIKYKGVEVSGYSAKEAKEIFVSLNSDE